MEEDTLLRENILFARENGFEIHTVMGSELSEAIAEYARRAGVTDLFLGYSPPSFFLQARRPLNERLLHYLPSVDIHIIPDQISSSFPGAMKKEGVRIPWSLQDLLRVFAIMAVATFLALWFYHSRFSNSNIITIYILAVLIASVMTSSRIYGLLAAVLYVLLFNFLFIEPRFTLLVYDSAYLMTYLVTIVAALITGTVTIRMKNIAAVSAENAYQTKILLDTSNQLERAVENEDILRTTCMQLVHLLRRTVLFCPADPVLKDTTASKDDTRSPEDIVLYLFPAGAKAAQTSRFRPLQNDPASIREGSAFSGKNTESGQKDEASPQENAVSSPQENAGS
ncbi:MAG: DUF4118 domain-containing protein, partial [Eubacteriales bacterium]|nr:DUF4118 domain-containing protein [Eubacteriales bacterium]